jgi:serine/threonine-protein kinase OSR1/STK39
LSFYITGARRQLYWKPIAMMSNKIDIVAETGSLSSGSTEPTTTATTMTSTKHAEKLPPTPVITVEWPTDALSYNLICKIGQGAFATVWKAQKIIPTSTSITDNSGTTVNTTDSPILASDNVTITTTTATTIESNNSDTNTTDTAAEAAAAANLLLQQLSLEQPIVFEQQQPATFVSCDTSDTTSKPSSISSRNSSGTQQLDCAVKVLDLDHVDTNLSEIRLEVQAMRLLSHINVLQCLTAFVVDRHLWLITPMMRKGSSLHCLQTARRVLRKQQLEIFHRQYQQQQQQLGNQQQYQQPPPPMSMEQHIMYIIHETLLGLQYIHDNGQIHRDIKAGNILLDDTGVVKIADFGVSGWLVQGGSRQEKAKTFVGTPCWMAPEVMEQVNGYDYKADIWSLGITALELARGYAPYAKYPPMKVLILTIQESPPSLLSYDTETEGIDEYDSYYVNPETSSIRIAGQEVYSRTVFESFVASCLQKNPTKRPTCAELLSVSKFFGEYNVSSSATNISNEPHREAFVNEICSIVPDVGSSTNSNGASGQHNRMPGNTPISIILSQTTDENRPAGTTWVFADGSSSNSQIIQSSSGSIVSSSHHHNHDDVLAELDEFERQTGGENYTAPSTRNQSIDDNIANIVNETYSNGAANTNDDDDNSSNCNDDTIRAGNQHIQQSMSIEHHEHKMPTFQQQATLTTTTALQQPQQEHQQHQQDESTDDNMDRIELRLDNSTDTDDLDDFMNEFEKTTSGEDFRKTLPS